MSAWIRWQMFSRSRTDSEHPRLNTRVKLAARFLQGRIAFVTNDPVRRSLRADR
jgi:hypothetical protein